MVPGYRFCPTNDELILDYLLPKVNGEAVPGEGNCAVFDFNLYGAMEPAKIWEEFEVKRKNDLKKNNDLYFFTTLRCKTSNGRRISRTVGQGTWKAEDSRKKICSCGSIIGYRKRFSYAKSGCEKDVRWIMHEFEVEKLPLGKPKGEENKTVLCLLRKNEESEKKRKHGDMKEEEIMLGDNMDVYDDNRDNELGDLDRKQAVLLETQEKRQCVLPSNVDHQVPPPPVQPSEEFDDQPQQFLMQFFEYCNKFGPQVTLEPEPIALHGEQNWDLQHWFMSGIDNGTPPILGIDQLPTGEENWGQQSFMSGLDYEQSFTTHHEPSTLQGNDNLGQQYFVPAPENVKPLAVDNGLCAFQQGTDQVQHCRVPGINNIVPATVAQMQGTSQVEQSGANSNVTNGSMINNTMPHTPSLPTYGRSSDQATPAASGNVYEGSGSVGDGFRNNPWIKSFAEQLLAINCCPKFN